MGVGVGVPVGVGVGDAVGEGLGLGVGVVSRLHASSVRNKRIARHSIVASSVVGARMSVRTVISPFPLAFILRA